MIFDLKKTSVAVHNGWITDGYAMCRKEYCQLIGDNTLKEQLLTKRASFYHQIPDGRNNLISQYKKGIEETVKRYDPHYSKIYPRTFVDVEDGIGIHFAFSTIIAIRYYIGGTYRRIDNAIYVSRSNELIAVIAPYE